MDRELFIVGILGVTSGVAGQQVAELLIDVGAAGWTIGAVEDSRCDA